MARELSAVLDHVATIGELDLDDVAPTSHVVAAIHPPRCARTSRARACRARSRSRRRRRSATTASSSRARRHERATLLELSAAQAARRDRRAARCRASELFDALPRARRRRPRRRARQGLNCFTWVAERQCAGGRAPARAAPLGWRAAGGQGPVLHRGRAQPVGLADPRGLPAAVHRHRRRAPERRRRDACWRRPTRTSSRWAPPPRTPRSAPCATRGTARACPAAPPAAAPPRSPPAWPRGRSAPTPAARSASPPRCAGSSG